MSLSIFGADSDSVFFWPKNNFVVFSSENVFDDIWSRFGLRKFFTKKCLSFFSEQILMMPPLIYSMYQRFAGAKRVWEYGFF